MVVELKGVGWREEGRRESACYNRIGGVCEVLFIRPEMGI
jgi:hypothetical protein